VSSTNEKTTIDHWNKVWTKQPRLRFPSSFNVATRNIKRLLRAYAKPGDRVLEIGCAPGKVLAWVAGVLNAEVTGIDYSKQGIEFSQILFQALKLRGDLRYENLFETTLAKGSFDLVYSLGVIEHFDDPRDIVERHVLLCRPGGHVIMAVPNYGCLYGSVQRWFDPENLKIHNLRIMQLSALRDLAPNNLVSHARAYATGCMSPWIINFHRRWPQQVSTAISFFLNGAGLVQPFRVQRLCPMLVLELIRGA
jgi:2-polyprenyl-3-methyl-5-hydroxy-6-metoxy-1,4-benzoquinol methylase